MLPDERSDSEGFTRSHAKRVSQSKTRFGGEMKKPLADRMTVPSARSPSPAGEAVAPVQDLRELDATEARDREKRSRLHLDDEAAFVPAPRHAWTRLPIDCVGGPGLASRIIVIVLPQYRFDRLEGTPCGSDFTRRRQIVIRGAFVANRCGRNHDTPNVNGFDEDPSAAAGDELAASEGDHMFQARRRVGSADPGMNDG